MYNFKSNTAKSPWKCSIQGQLSVFLVIKTTNRRNPVQNALVYILFCVAQKKSENRAMGHDS